MTLENRTTIEAISQFEDKIATLQGWVHNIRSSKSLVFIIVRDGSGLCQCIVSKDDADEETWEQANALTQESSLRVSGTVLKDERSSGGFEMHVSAIEVTCFVHCVTHI